MFLKRCLILFCMLSLLTLAAVAESPLSFPCDSELSPFLSRSEHDVTFKIDLENNYRIETDYWGDEPMLVESGSFLILDDEFMLVNLRFSKEYDYSQDYGGNLPDIILLANFDLSGASGCTRMKTIPMLSIMPGLGISSRGTVSIFMVARQMHKGKPRSVFI